MCFIASSFVACWFDAFFLLCVVVLRVVVVLVGLLRVLFRKRDLTPPLAKDLVDLNLTGYRQLFVSMITCSFSCVVFLECWFVACGCVAWRVVLLRVVLLRRVVLRIVLMRVCFVSFLVASRFVACCSVACCVEAYWFVAYRVVVCLLRVVSLGVSLLRVRYVCV